MFYLEHGYEQAKTETRRNVAIFEFKDEYSDEFNYSVVIAAIIDEDKLFLVEWLVESLEKISQQRLAWIHMELASQPDAPEVPQVPDELMVTSDEKIAKALVRDGKFRLLLSLIGFNIPDGEQHLHCMLPGSVEVSSIEESLKYLKRYMFESVTFPDGKEAADFIRRVKPDKRQDENGREGTASALREDLGGFIVRNVSDDELEENDYNDSIFADSRFALPEEEIRAAQLQKLGDKRKHRNRPRIRIENGKAKRIRVQNEDAVERRRKEQFQKESRFKSAAFVHDSDDESDEEKDRDFFERENNLRQNIQRDQTEKEDSLATQSQLSDENNHVEIRSDDYQSVQMTGNSDTEEVSQSVDISAAARSSLNDGNSPVEFLSDDNPDVRMTDSSDSEEVSEILEIPTVFSQVLDPVEDPDSLEIIDMNISQKTDLEPRTNPAINRRNRAIVIDSDDDE